MTATLAPCYCGQFYSCEDCGGDVCNCTCERDGAPQTQAEVTAGYVNPSQARMDAWQTRQDLRK
ncbi:hypothetical protein PV761_03440 [Arthrobacter sp. CC3]|uniref:hypothetical protein n=1 Tax=Arthrobacter sp. CC3 TaxID=3029185 RepID=UPI003264480E